MAGSLSKGKSLAAANPAKEVITKKLSRRHGAFIGPSRTVDLTSHFGSAGEAAFLSRFGRKSL
jgi:hypothetical protein